MRNTEFKLLSRHILLLVDCIHITTMSIFVKLESVSISFIVLKVHLTGEKRIRRKIKNRHKETTTKEEIKDIKFCLLKQLLFESQKKKK